MKSATIRATIPPDHRLVVQVPEDVPAGPAEIVVRPVEPTGSERGTAADLLASGLFGIWKDRADIRDSSQFARELRQRALQWFAKFRLSHGTGIMDCLIGATAARLAVPFYTFNARHFAPLEGVDGRQPYDRAPAA